MNREIKFRAWDGKKMIFANIAKWHRIYDMVKCFRANNGELMQYTGINDKNGKEIYEGDIVMDCRLDEDFENNKYIIFYDNAQFYAENLEDENWQDITKYLEVIGNIYENPELLEGK